MQRLIPVQTQPRAKELFTYGEIAGDLRVSPRTVADLVRKGLITTVDVSPGGLKRITSAERARLLTKGIQR